MIADIDVTYCSCVSTVRKLGANPPKGDAKDLITNGIPTVGGIVKFKYGEIYHIAYIQFFVGNGMWIQEGNFVVCEFTERFVSFNNPFIIGFWQE